MKIFETKKTAKRPRIMMVTVSTKEAHALIQSLANQLVAGNPNTGRLETFCEDGTDFSIAVDRGRQP